MSMKRWLKQAGIASSAAPGCNAIVVEYVFSSLMLTRDGFSSHERTVGDRWLVTLVVVWQARLRPRDQTHLYLPRADRGDEGIFSLDELSMRIFLDFPYATSKMVRTKRCIWRMKTGSAA